MQIIEMIPGGFQVKNADGLVVVNQPFDPRTGEPFPSDEEALEYANANTIAKVKEVVE
jgi:hypothetical protein